MIFLSNWFNYLFLDSSSSKSVFERIGASCDREKSSPGLVSKSGK